MKNKIPVVLAIALLSSLFMQCKKEDSSAVFNAMFYTSQLNGRISLYIDDTYKGALPYFSKAPECGQVYGDGQSPLTIQLPSGKYKIVGKDDGGKTIVISTIDISKNEMKTSGGIGGLSLSNDGDCLVISLFE